MTPARARMPSIYDRLAPAALLALAMLLRLREALRAPLWYDELYSRAAIERTWPDVMRVMHADVHPPLPYLLGWAWRAAGSSDLAIRSLSLVFAFAALWAGWRLARELFGRGAATLALLLLALQPWHVYLSQEARSYPLLWLGLTLSALGAWRWCGRGRKRDALLFVLGSALALWTHYLAGVLLAMQAAWGLVRLSREPRRLGAWIGLHALVAVMFAPLLPLMWAQFHRIEGEHWLMPPTFADLIDVGRRFSFGNVRLLVPAIALSLWPLGEPAARRPVSFALVLGPLSVLACFALGTLGIRVFALKYMMFALAPFLALVAAGALRLPGRTIRWLVAAAMVVIAARALSLQPAYPEAASFRVVRERLAWSVRPGDSMFHSDTHTLLFGLHYYPQQRHRLLLMGQRIPYYEGAAVIPDSVLADASELRAAARRGARWWALSWGKGGVGAGAFTACVDSFATAPAESCGIVRLWRSKAVSQPVDRIAGESR